MVLLGVQDEVLIRSKRKNEKKKITINESKRTLTGITRKRSPSYLSKGRCISQDLSVIGYRDFVYRGRRVSG